MENKTGKRGIADRLLFLLSVPRCVNCKERLSYGDLAFCPECSVGFEEFKTRNCSVCSLPLVECSCSFEGLSDSYVRRVLKVFRYIPREENKLPNSLVFALKQANRRDVIDRCARELSVALGNSGTDFSDWIVTNVPRRRSAILKYGFDHAEQLAIALARSVGAVYLPLLKSKSRAAQKQLSSEQRRENVEFIIKGAPDLKGKRVLIVDDVITTGASVAEAARLIHSLGAKEIVAASLSIAYKDRNIPF